MVPHYHINMFWSDEDGAWIAEVPDLPGCSTHGRTPADAAREAEDAMALWLETAADEGVPIPRRAVGAGTQGRLRPSVRRN